MALLNTLSDNFNTAGAIDATKWTFTNQGVSGSASCIGGQLVCNCGTTVAYNGESHVVSLNTYDTTGNGAYVAVPTISSDPTKTWTGLVVKSSANPANEQLTIYVDGTTNTLYVVGQNNTGFGTYAATYTYSATTHYWWRIRESAGTIYYDTAPSTAANPPASGDWVNRGSVVFSTLTWTGVITSVYAEMYLRLVATATSTAPTNAFDGFNTATGTSGSTYNTAISETATVTDTESVLVNFAVANSASILLTDSSSGGMAAAAALAETATITDTVNGVRSYASAVTESMVLTDLYSPLLFWDHVDTGPDATWTVISD